MGEPHRGSNPNLRESSDSNPTPSIGPRSDLWRGTFRTRLGEILTFGRGAGNESTDAADRMVADERSVPVASTGNRKPRRGDPRANGGEVLAAPTSGEARAHVWAGQQQALAALGQAALTSDDVDTLLSEAVRR